MLAEQNIAVLVLLDEQQQPTEPKLLSEDPVMRDPLVIHVVRHGRTHSNRVGLVMGWANESIEPDQHDAADAVAAGGRSHTGADCVEPTRPGPRHCSAPRCRPLGGSGDRCSSR
jgi:hypothetical protein